MKRIFAAVLALTLLLSLAACKKEQPSETDPTGTQATDAADSTDPTAETDNSGVDRSDVTVLSAITATGADGSTSYAYTWETLERRLMTTMTAEAGGTEMSLSFTYRETEKAGTVTGLSSGVVIDFVWDENGRIVTLTETSTGGTYSAGYTYDEEGRCVEKTVSRNGELASTVAYTYEGGALVKEITTLPDGSVSNQKTCAYNESGDLEQETTQWSGADEVVKKYTYTYNDSGNAISRITLDGADVQTDKHVYTYDADGRVLTDTAFDGETRTSHTEYTYDENGSLTKEQQYLTGEDAARTVEYTYTEVRMSDAEYALYQMLLERSQSWY